MVVGGVAPVCPSPPSPFACDFPLFVVFDTDLDSWASLTIREKATKKEAGYGSTKMRRENETETKKVEKPPPG